ncbi:hypothetical protein Cs7R123_62320 [Catellatospora sp. TT07R-123]|uniref:anti-sigma-D factor RsdA n=1 Tax=Catellatospora sp. TT07R-123 TaxID=2733863 RepID=UPI001B19759E|nr:anti-sigma-D factor RsdA [Catellatospora sp. TT07R-123]GHJ48890.1 hypothetical protein Cs7R123_62320 [Catellatospora sp. TT07R-123]
MTGPDRDDELLDALATGGAAPDGDRVAALLAAWRDDVAGTPAADGAGPGLRSAPHTSGGVRTPPQVWPRTGTRPGRRRPSRALVASAAVVVALVGGVALAAGNARPDSPLWPVTRVLYADRADSRLAARDAQRLLDQAKLALRDRRRDDAAALLRKAETTIELVSEESDRRRLTITLQKLLAAIADPHLAVAGGQAPVPSATPGTVAPSPSAGAAAPSPTRGRGGLPPLLPSLPPLLPSLPPILPSLPPILPPLPPLLPSGLGGLG